jgi:general stress protein 26
VGEDLAARAKKIIDRIIYVTVATSTNDGVPWNSPVSAAHDADYNFYWASWVENVHSRNIRENEDVFLVIYDSTAPEGMGEGVYIKAKACELTDRAEIEKAIRTCSQRDGREPDSPDDYSGAQPRRMYKAVPEKAWVNGFGDVDGNYVDIRTEIQL